ncbi:D-aminoacyl-tRNA deacylase 1-like [Bolinopsis microptera]|uniref:D-aminoacyl-tRNA deacylase 1-like n=1 Tax=Bolinopsis microptera TaxID=2820187 RepID=UPI003078C87A
MKAIVQKVTEASVTVGERCTGSIGRGMCVLIGISAKDSDREIEWMANKLIKLRIFNNPETDKPWDGDLLQCKLAILVVSQFTLQCVVNKGTRPDFHQALKSEQSLPMFNKFLDVLRSKIPNAENLVQVGEFGAFMQVHIQNDGPVTIPIESPESI